jgi:hypothetical protein
MTRITMYIAPRTVAPLHSYTDRKMFYVLSRKIESLS